MTTEFEIGNFFELTAPEERIKMMAQFREMEQLYNAAIREVKTKLDVLDGEFNVKFAHNPIHHMESRQKSISSIIGKLRKKNLPLTLEAARRNLTDIAGIRVICYYIDDIYRIANLLALQADVMPIKVRDYIARPKENGYRSLHVVVLVPVFLSTGAVSVPVEIQIRTIAMDFWASLEHQLRYKTDESVPEGVPKRLARCAEASAALDVEMEDIYHAINGFGGNTMTSLSPELARLVRME